MPEMSGRVALITGAASGIGLATAEALAREGADVALLSRPDDDLDAATRRVEAHGGKVIALGADVADSAAVRGAFGRVEAELGPIDAVHNNAGISIVCPLTDTTDDVFRRLVDTNLAGSFYVLREAARVMQRRRAGAVVNTASELAVMGQAGYVAYTATKGAILAMTRSAAAELSSWGIRVNAVCPGTTKTPMFLAEFDGAADPEAELADNAASVAMQRIAEPAEIAEAVVFLLSHRAGYITGTHLIADGGRTACVPTGSIGVSTGVSPALTTGESS
jgi:NAD(P)-dependent dehydrogenase (short-subunit alcohol dehydrogenase family)